MFLLFFFFLGIRYEDFVCFQYFLLKVNKFLWTRLKIVKIESCRKWKWPKLKSCQNWKLINLKIDKIGKLVNCWVVYGCELAIINQFPFVLVFQTWKKKFTSVITAQDCISWRVKVSVLPLVREHRSPDLVGLQANWTTSALWGLVKIGLSKFLVSHMTTVSSQYDATLYIRNYKLEDG